jgi:myo-inositol catabolism protein IolC
MDDARLPFDDAVQEFRAFLRSQGWPADILWLSRDRVVGRRRTYWVFRPGELVSDQAARAFYEAVRRTPSSIRLDAVAQVRGRSLAYVLDYGGPNRMLDFGVLTEPWTVRPASSRLAWAGVRAASRLWGGTPFLRGARITGTAASAEDLGAAAAAFFTRDIRRWVA